MRFNDTKAFVQWEKKANKAVLSMLPGRGVERTIMFEAFDPTKVVVWLVTWTDEQRDALLADLENIQQLIEEPLFAVDPDRGYTTLLLTAESEETVERVFNGDWWAAIK